MKIEEIYNLAIEMGKKADFRGEKGVERALGQRRKRYKVLPEKEKIPLPLQQPGSDLPHNGQI